MKSYKIYCFIWLLVISICPGCLPYYYAPNSQNIPLFRQKGEAKAEALVGAGMLTGGVEFKGAYAVGNHVGMTFNTFFNKGAQFYTDPKARGHLIEAGIGYFGNLRNEKFVFEAYTGVGGGEIYNHYNGYQTVNNSEGSSTIEYSRYFFQPSIGFVYRNFEAALSVRLAKLNFNTITTDGGVTKDLNDLNNNNSMFLIEPAATIRYGFKPVKLQVQLLSSRDYNNFPLEMEFRYFSFGIFFSIPAKIKSSQEIIHSSPP